MTGGAAGMSARGSFLERLARFVLDHRRAVIGTWAALAIAGAVVTPAATKRLSTEFAIPGKPAYEANARIAAAFGNGRKPPLTVVVQSPGRDVTKVPRLAALLGRAAARVPRGRASSFFTTGSSAYVSADRSTTFMNVYEPGPLTFAPDPLEQRLRRSMDSAAPPGVRVYVTGTQAIADANGPGAGGPSVLAEGLLGGLGALLVLLFVFGTLPAVAMPLVVAVASIFASFGAVWALTFATTMSNVVQFLVALVGLGIAIDYALLIVFRFREEIAGGNSSEDAVVATVLHAGKAVAVSGSTVAIGLLALLALPLPFIRSIGIGGMLIASISVLCCLTLLPALLACLGTNIDRLRILPVRATTDRGLWRRLPPLLLRRPALTAACGVTLAALLLVPASQINAANGEARYFPGKGPAIEGRNLLAAKGITADIFKPLDVLVEGDRAPEVAGHVARVLRHTPGVAAAVAPRSWTRPRAAIVEAFTSADGSSHATAHTIARLEEKVLPALAGPGARITVAGQAAQERDFLDAVYGNFTRVLAILVILTFLLLARAFRSVVLPLKAVALNLVSLGASLGVVVFVFQQGHGAKTLFGVGATQSVTAWIPLMIFAFLYGISMDYEVFMLSRIREEYDRRGSTEAAVEAGLRTTGKLVSSAALILMLAFLALSLSPGVDIKEFAIGAAAGVIVDATVLRILLVPALISLLGDWNWWLPRPLGRLLRVAE
jgi:RND superfamily putative drug exporter